MSDLERADEPTPIPAAAGARLRAARDAAGLTLMEVGERTRVPVRHLESIEGGDYASLPSPTYATGFARAYARAVGLDEVGIAAQVRAEAARLGRRQPEYEPYVTADPARLPSRGLAILGLGAAVAVLVLAAMFLGSGWLRGGGPGEEVAAPATQPIAPPASIPAATPTAATAAPRQVTLTAQDEVWLRVYDGADKTLFLGTMKPGDRFDVPPGADRPRINVGRPDKLQVALDGKPAPALGTGERPIKDVAVDAASIAARASGLPAPALASGPAPQATAAPLIAPSPASTHRAPRPRPRAASEEDEVARANRRSERAAEQGRTPPAPVATSKP